jgi:hypothetical protein
MPEELHITYGINRRRPGRRRKSDIEHSQGEIWITGTWGDDATHSAIRAAIYRANPGWQITGYCNSTPLRK